jgi:hypothetical protein
MWYLSSYMPKEMKMLVGTWETRGKEKMGASYHECFLKSDREKITVSLIMHAREKKMLSWEVYALKSYTIDLP